MFYIILLVSSASGITTATDAATDHALLHCRAIHDHT